MLAFAVYVKWLVVGLGARGIYDCLFKSRVTSKKLTTFLFASIVICKWLLLKNLRIDFFIYSIFRAVVRKAAKPYVISVKANLVSANFFRRLT